MICRFSHALLPIASYVTQQDSESMMEEWSSRFFLEIFPLKMLVRKPLV